MPSLLNDAAHWHLRAQETRDLAAAITDEETKQTLLKIAEGYERLATRAAEGNNRN
jgi:hypothetical protein